MKDDFIAIARVSELSMTGRLEVTLNGQRIALFQTPTGIYATAADCPHRGGPLVAGWLENESIFCPLHGWEFDLRTGKCKSGAESRLECYSVKISGDEILCRINE